MVIVDSDMGIDDVMAIIYLVQRPTVDVKAITIAQGVSNVETGTEIALGLLSILGRPDIPVVKGRPNPLHGKNSFPKAWHPSTDKPYGLNLPKTSAKVSTMTVTEIVCNLVEQSPKKVSMVALGPLTNIAMILQDKPTLSTAFNKILVGDGAINVSGNINEEYPYIHNRVSGWNLWQDSYAAQVVFSSGAELVVNPLDVTYPTGQNPILLTRRFADYFHDVAEGTAGKIMDSLIQTYLQEWDSKMDAVPLWDVVTAAIFDNPNICTDCRNLSIRIDTKSPDTEGRTLIKINGKLNSWVCMAGDLKTFEKYLGMAGFCLTGLVFEFFVLYFWPPG